MRDIHTSRQARLALAAQAGVDTAKNAIVIDTAIGLTRRQQAAIGAAVPRSLVAVERHPSGRRSLAGEPF